MALASPSHRPWALQSRSNHVTWPQSPGPSAISVFSTKGKERFEEKFMVSSAECWGQVT